MFLLAALAGWVVAAAHDWRTRHVPNAVFLVLALLALARGVSGGVQPGVLAVSVGVVTLLALGLYRWAAFGGADVKALVVAALLYPAAIGVFCIGTAVCLLGFAGREEIPAVVAIAGGAAVATGYLLL